MNRSYKRNKNFCPINVAPEFKAQSQTEKILGPFKSCGNCPYAAHGFICFGHEGDCMKTKIDGMNRRKKDELYNKITDYKTSSNK